MIKKLFKKIIKYSFGCIEKRFYICTRFDTEVEKHREYEKQCELRFYKFIENIEIDSVKLKSKLHDYN